MHEFSLAEALLEQVQRHTPADGIVKSVTVRVGAMQLLVPDAMQWAWQSLISDTPFADATLTLDMIPWELTCLACGRKWATDDMNVPCICGSTNTSYKGTDDLILMSLDVDVPDDSG